MLSMKGCMRKIILAVLLCASALPAFTQGKATHMSTRSDKIELQAWHIQSGCKARATGDVISTPAFKTSGWQAATVPTTVLGALVTAGVYPDPYYAMNLRKIPGTSYPIEKKFAELPMPDDSPFKCAWWYRTEFQLPANYKGRSVALHFDGINYRANVWLNGKLIANSKDVAGAYRTYDFPIAAQARAGQKNILAVETFAPTEKDLGINWVDWNPAPADKDMGLWRGVWISSSGPVAVRHPQIVSKVETGASESADLTISAEVTNTTEKPVKGRLTGRIERINFSQPFALTPGETKVVTFTPADFRQLHIANPRLWWPWQMGGRRCTR